MNLSNTISTIIQRSPFVLEAMNAGLINVTSLARYLQKDIEEQMRKTVTTASIVMAIKRLPSNPLMILDKSISTYMRQLGDIIVRSDLIDYSYQNSPTLLEKQVRLLQRLDQRSKFFYTFCKGVHETTFILSKTLDPLIKEIFADEQLIVSRRELAAVSVMLPTTNMDVYGVYYTILKRLAWQGINVVEVISTSHEITLIVSIAEVDQVFSILMNMKAT